MQSIFTDPLLPFILQVYECAEPAIYYWASVISSVISIGFPLSGAMELDWAVDYVADPRWPLELCWAHRSRRQTLDVRRARQGQGDRGSGSGSGSGSGTDGGQQFSSMVRVSPRSGPPVLNAFM